MNYDVIHVHCCSNRGFLPAVMGVTAGNRLGKRVVLTYHGGSGDKFFDRHTWLVKRFLSQTDANIVLSGYLANVFKKHGLPCVVIPNIIETDGDRFKLRDQWAPKFICTRSHEPLYNIPCILRAFHKIQSVRPDASLTLVGDGSQHQQLKRMVEEMRLQHVSFTGRVLNNDIYHYLSQADVMLSAAKADNMPVSLFEAMNAGLLVIAARVGGVPYVIMDGENGLLFESDNDSQLAEKMIWSMEHQDLVRNMVLKSWQSLQQYQWNGVKNKLFAVYGLLA